jgi:hypothetical protein
MVLLQVNKRTRNRAYDVLVQIGHTFGDEEKGGKKENLYQFFNMVSILYFCLQSFIAMLIEIVVIFIQI